MNTRLRNQVVTVKPRIVVNGDSFKVEYYGHITKQHVSVGYPTLEKALGFANAVASFYPEQVKAINRERAMARLERRAAELGVAA